MVPVTCSGGLDMLFCACLIFPGLAGSARLIKLCCAIQAQLDKVGYAHLFSAVAPGSVRRESVSRLQLQPW